VGERGGLERGKEEYFIFSTKGYHKKNQTIIGDEKGLLDRTSCLLEERKAGREY